MAKAKIGVGIVGVTPGRSWAAVTHIPALRALPDYEVAALSTSKAETAKAAAEALGVKAAFDNHDDLIAHSGVDLVVVTVKVPNHLELVTAALNAGKMVFCEWPLGNGLKEAQFMAAHAKRAGVNTVVGLQGRVAPTIGYMRDLIREGYVGDVLSTTLVGSATAWGPTIPRYGAYLFDRKNGATALSIPVGHTIDALCLVLGEFASVSAVLESRRKAVTVIDDGEVLPVTSPDQVLVSGVLQSGATAAVHYNGDLTRGTNMLWQIHGTEGDLRVTAATGHLQTNDLLLEGGRSTDKTVSKLTVPEKYRWVPADLTQPVMNVAQVYGKFAAELKGGARLTADFEHAVQRHKLIAAIEDSAATGKRVQL